MADSREIALRILSELEEFGAENISSTMNTVLDITGAEVDVEIFQDALEALIRTGQAEIGYVDDTKGKIESVSAKEALMVAQTLPQSLKFDAGQGFWIWDEKQPWAQIVLSPGGFKTARELLDERGYQWWRKDR